MNSLQLRQADYHYIIDCVQSGASCSIIGLSNTGKSMLLRELAACVKGCEQTFVYIDCNRMLAATDQGFYEAILRSLQETLSHTGAPPDVMARLGDCYRQAVQGENPFLVPLGFNDAILLACQTLPGGIVLLLDEFDEAYATLDSRVFLNLRALHDKHRDKLLYVTATVKPLRAIQSSAAYGEFYELVSYRERYLGMLSQPDARALMHHYAARQGVDLDEAELQTIWQQAGGHPALLAVVVQLLIDVEAGAPELYRQQGLTLVTERLDRSELAQVECVKLWHQLSEGEQEVLLTLAVEGQGRVTDRTLSRLHRQGIIVQTDSPRFFGERFAAFVRRRRRTEMDYPEGIWVDVDAGDVWVEGDRVATLTELEYRLLQTLYGRMGKLCDKYLIVESVWGQEYLDTVDDARIEKLVSRLRSKIEPDPSEPRYLVTIRGRGYKLVQDPVAG
jgi:DNA-binding response OmpR family regulator